MAMESVTLEKGEEVREYYPDAHIIGIPVVPPFRDGCLAFTSKRVLWIMRMGKTSVHLDFPFERVKGVTTKYGLLSRTVSIVDNNASYLFELRGSNNHKAGCPQEMVCLPTEEKEVKTEKSDSEVVKIGMVFPPLKDHMNTDAQVLEIQKCPDCGPSEKLPISLPDDKIQYNQCHRQY